MRFHRCIFAFVLAACSSGETRVHLEVTADAAWSLDHYQLAIGERTALAAPLPALDVEVPDSMAGHAATLEVWGLAAGQQVAYGMTSVTPVLHGTVTVAVTLSAVSCGLFCTEGAVECSDNGTSTCMMQSNGCLAWSTVTPCPMDAPDCSNGACAATCTDECATGQTECDTAEAVRICGQYDSDSCLDWSPAMACASGQTCSNGICGTTVTCTQDGASCDDGNACTTSDTCEGGTCSGTPKCTAAPANADPTCAAAGTCGFTCHTGYMASGASCVQEALAQMPTARGGLAVVVGPDGLIYAIGGADGTSILATVEAYNPSTNVWTTRASMPTARGGLAAAVGSDGLIYAIGGYHGADWLTTVEAYTPSTNTWTTRVSMPTARDALAAVVGSDGLIYAIGGYDGTNNFATVEAFNTATNMWTTRASMPTARAELAAAVGPDGLIYAIGGDAGHSVTTVAAYSPSTNTWTTRASMSTARENLAATVGSDGLIYAIGGVNSGGTTLATVEAYSTESNTWASSASMPTARFSLGAASASGLIYAIGGETTNGTPLSTVEAYTVGSNTWW